MNQAKPNMINSLLILIGIGAAIVLFAAARKESSSASDPILMEDSTFDGEEFPVPAIIDQLVPQPPAPVNHAIPVPVPQNSNSQNSGTTVLGTTVNNTAVTSTIVPPAPPKTPVPWQTVFPGLPGGYIPPDPTYMTAAQIQAELDAENYFLNQIHLQEQAHDLYVQETHANQWNQLMTGVQWWEEGNTPMMTNEDGSDPRGPRNWASYMS